MYFRKNENDPRMKTWAVRRNFSKNTNEGWTKSKEQAQMLTTLWNVNNREQRIRQNLCDLEIIYICY